MNTGLVGLGTMGTHMAANLHQAGALRKVWNRSPRDFGTLRGYAAASLEELAQSCELIILSVSRDADVLEVLEQLRPGLRPNSVVADTSTVSAATARQAAEICRQAQAHFLDCPVSGGSEGAKQGTLAIMAGGEEAVLERCRPTLSHIAGKIVHIGDCGSGQACKAVNQIMAAGINQAVTEALAFGAAQGLNMSRVLDVVSAGAAGNWFLSHRGASMLEDSFSPGFKLSLHHKDLHICREMNREQNENDLPIVEMTLVHYQRLMDEGHGDEDISALFRLKRALRKPPVAT